MSSYKKFHGIAQLRLKITRRTSFRKNINANIPFYPIEFRSFLIGETRILYVRVINHTRLTSIRELPRGLQRTREYLGT